MKGELPDGEYTITLGQANVKREGKDVSLVSTAMMVQSPMEVAQRNYPKRESKSGLSTIVLFCL